MPQISLANALVLLDSIAKQVDNVINLGWGVNTTGYTNNQNLILTSNDIDVESDLIGAFRNNPVAQIQTPFEARRQALEKHLGGIAAFLRTNDARIHPNLRDYLGWINDPLAIFLSPAKNLVNGSTHMGAGTITGANVVAWAANGNNNVIDLTRFGKVWLEAEVRTAIGAGGGTVTVTGTKVDGTAQSKTFALAGGETVGTKVNIGVLGTSADHFASVTGLTFAGTSASGVFNINTRLERTIAL
jgi:hypothetical protein